MFAGGGAKAAYEAGVGLALHERGIVPAAIAGTSAGAINAVLLATGEVERLAELWRTIRREDVIAYRAPAVLGGLLPGWLGFQVIAGARGLLDPAPLRATLARHVDLERLRSSAPVAVLVVATDLVSGTAQRFDNETLTLDALVASATVPGLFPARRRGRPPARRRGCRPASPGPGAPRGPSARPGPGGCRLRERAAPGGDDPVRASSARSSSRSRGRSSATSSWRGSAIPGWTCRCWRRRRRSGSARSTSTGRGSGRWSTLGRADGRRCLEALGYSS